MRRFIPVAIIAAIYAYLAAASAIYLAGRGLWRLYTPPYLQWITAARWMSYDRATAFWVEVSAVIPLVVLLIAAALTIRIRMVAARRRRLQPVKPGKPTTEPERAASSLHGTARWMTMDEAKAVFPGPHPKWGGIPVGEAYRPDQDETARPFDEADPLTWGRGGKAELLMSPLSSGAICGLIFGGPGSYKTNSFTIPALLTWLGSCVAMDPKCKIGSMVREWREAIGQTVVLIDPIRGTGGFNPLACIDIKHPLAIDHLNEFIDWCAPSQPIDNDKDDNGKAFSDWGKELQVCILADLVFDTDLPAGLRTLREWRSRLVTPEAEMPKYLEDIYDGSKSQFARDLAGTLMRVVSKTFSGLYRHATGDTKWLSIPAYANLLSGSAFDPAALTGGKLTVILQIPDGAMQTTPAVGRIVIGSLARVMLRAGGRTATPVPFILDEMNLLKRMPILAVLRDMGRESGVALFPMFQSVGQIEGTWGRDGKRSWYAAAAWRLYTAINDEDTAREVNKRCGTYTVLARSEGSSVNRPGGPNFSFGTRGQNDNVSEQPRQLLSEYDAQTALRPDEAIVIVRGQPALRCGRPLYWRRHEMDAVIAKDTSRVAAE